MGFKIGKNWVVDSITPEGKEEWIAESNNVCVAKAAYKEALKHRYGRVVRFRQGGHLLCQAVGTQRDWWQPNPPEMEKGAGSETSAELPPAQASEPGQGLDRPERK